MNGDTDATHDLAPSPGDSVDVRGRRDAGRHDRQRAAAAPLIDELGQKLLDAFGPLAAELDRRAREISGWQE